MTKKRPSHFYSGVCFFVLTSIIAKIIGAIYRIPLTNILGIEGIAQYQLVFPFFSLIIAIICGGVPTTISRLVAYQNCLEHTSEVGGIGGIDCGKQKNSNLVAAAFFYVTLFSFVGSLLCAALASPLSKLQGNSDIYICYLAIAPCIFFVGIASVLKGYFLGKGNMSPSSIANLVEQVIKLSIGLLFAKIFMKYGKIYSVAGALVAITIAEILELLILLFLFFRSKPTRPQKLSACLGQNSKMLFKNLTPITLSGLIFPIVAFVDSLVIISLIVWKNANIADATSQYGLLTGPINSLINMPVVLSLALSMAIVPAVSSALAGYDVECIKTKTSLSLKFSLFLSTPCFFGFFALARPLLQILYPTISDEQMTLAVQLLQVASINVITLSTLEILSAMLQGLDRSNKVLKNVAIGGATKLVLQCVLIPYLQIIGVVIANIVFYTISMTLNIFLYKKLVGKNPIFFQNVSKILASGAIMFLLVGLSTHFLDMPLAKFLVGLCVGIASYIALTFAFKAIEKSDISSLCFFKKPTEKD